MSQQPHVLSYQTATPAAPLRLAGALLLMWAGLLTCISLPLIMLTFICLGSLSIPGIVIAFIPGIPAIALVRLTIGSYRIGLALWQHRHVPVHRALDLAWQFEGGFYILASGAVLLGISVSFKLLLCLMPLLALALLLTYTRITLRNIQRRALP